NWRRSFCATLHYCLIFQYLQYTTCAPIALLRRFRASRSHAFARSYVAKLPCNETSDPQTALALGICRNPGGRIAENPDGPAPRTPRSALKSRGQLVQQLVEMDAAVTRAAALDAHLAEIRHQLATCCDRSTFT